MRLNIFKPAFFGLNGRMGIVLFIALLCLPQFAFVPSPLPITSLSLEDALKRSDLDLSFESLGGSSRDCVSLKAVNRSGKSIRIEVPAGTYLHHPENQDILVTRDAVIALNSGKEGQTELYGFCTQPHSSTPESEEVFKVLEPDKKWTELAGLLKDRGLDASVEQSVVWACTKDYPAGGLMINREKDKDLVEFITTVRGEEVPWYVMDYGDILDRPFQNQLSEVRGIMHYRCQRDLPDSDLYIYAPDGTVVMSIFTDRELEGGANYRFRFSMRGSNVEPGVYKMVLSSKGQTLDTREIEV